MLAGGRADMTKLIVAFRNFCKKKRLKHLRCEANSDTAAQLSDYVLVARKLKLPPKRMIYTPDRYHRRQFGTFQDESPDPASSASKLWMNFTPLLTRNT